MAEAQPSQLLCGLLFLLSEVLKARPELGSLKHFLKEEAGGVQKFKDEDDDDEEEHYEDVKEEDADSEVKKEGAVVTPGWTFKGAAGSSSVHSERNCYDPTARNPLYCGAGHTALWELERLSNHFHPSGKLVHTSLELLDSTRDITLNSLQYMRLPSKIVVALLSVASIQLSMLGSYMCQ